MRGILTLMLGFTLSIFGAVYLEFCIVSLFNGNYLRCEIASIVLLSLLISYQINEWTETNG